MYHLILSHRLQPGSEIYIVLLTVVCDDDLWEAVLHVGVYYIFLNIFGGRRGVYESSKHSCRDGAPQKKNF